MTTGKNNFCFFRSQPRAVRETAHGCAPIKGKLSLKVVYVVSKPFVRTGEVVSPYWGERTPVLGRSNPRTGRRIRSMGLTIPLHGSQNSAPWVSKIPCVWESESCLRPGLLAWRLYVVFHWLPPLLVFPIRPHEPMCRVLFHILRVSGYE